MTLEWAAELEPAKIDLTSVLVKSEGNILFAPNIA